MTGDVNEDGYLWGDVFNDPYFWISVGRQLTIENPSHSLDQSSRRIRSNLSCASFIFFD